MKNENKDHKFDEALFKHLSAEIKCNNRKHMSAKVLNASIVAVAASGILLGTQLPKLSHLKDFHRQDLAVETVESAQTTQEQHKSNYVSKYRHLVNSLHPKTYAAINEYTKPTLDEIVALDDLDFDIALIDLCNRYPSVYKTLTTQAKVNAWLKQEEMRAAELGK